MVVAQIGACSTCKRMMLPPLLLLLLLVLLPRIAYHTMAVDAKETRQNTTATNLKVSLSRIVSIAVGLVTGAGGGGGEGRTLSCCASMTCCSLNSASFGLLGLPWSMRAQLLCGGRRGA